MGNIEKNTTDQRLISVDRQFNDPTNKKNNDDRTEKSPHHWVDVDSNWKEIHDKASVNSAMNENIS